MGVPDGVAEHWSRAYERPEERLSWYQEVPEPSLGLIRKHAPDRASAIVDVGAGASTLVDALLAEGRLDLTLVDVSEEGLERARRRLGAAAARVTFEVADVTEWRPPRHWDVWHDRAVLHFMTTNETQEGYRRALLAGTAEGSIAIIGAFAPDGPDRCSGLPVQRWSAEGLADFLVPEFTLEESLAHRHLTPGGVAQSFVFAVFGRVSG